jgi:two-component system, OmpR family, response regulator
LVIPTWITTRTGGHSNWNDFLFFTISAGFVRSNITFKNLIMSKTTVETRASQKILIVEDEGEMCLVLNILLSDEDIELEHVKNLSAAEEYFSKEIPSLIILDNKLPDGFGVDYITHVKKKYPSVKIVMITGFDASAKDVAMENGADLFLEKPFTKQQFLTAIKSLLNLPDH